MYLSSQYFVYVFYDQNDIPFYVGKGKEHRWLDHIKEANRAIKFNKPRNRLSHKLNKIINLINMNIDPKIEIVFSNITLEEANLQEKELIKKYGRADLKLGTLTNLTDGGDGVNGRTTMKDTAGNLISILIEEKEQYEKLGYEHFNKGRKHSREINKRKAAYWKGSSRPEHGEKIRKAAATGAYKNNRGPIFSDELRQRTNEKLRKPKVNKEGFQNRKRYHSISLRKETVSKTMPDWPDVKRGSLPRHLRIKD